MSKKDLTTAIAAGDLQIMEGGIHADRIFLILIDESCRIELERFASGYLQANIDADKRPWLVVSRDTLIFFMIREFYLHPFGENAEVDEASNELLTHLPLHQLRLTSIQVEDPDDDLWAELSEGTADLLNVAISGPPPVMFDMYGPDLLEFVVKSSGLKPVIVPVDDDFMFVRYSDNVSSWSEQVLGWDDVYSKEVWEYIRSRGSIEASLRNDPAFITGKQIEAFGKALTEIDEETYFNS